MSERDFHIRELNGWEYRMDVTGANQQTRFRVLQLNIVGGERVDARL